MRVFLFSFWYLPDTRTAVNRIKYFKKIFENSSIDIKLIYCTSDANSNPPHENNSYQINHVHWFYIISNYCIKRNWILLYKIIHFFYLIINKRDVYDFYRNYLEIESEKAFQFKKGDIVITSAPPYSSLNIGHYLKQKYGVNWVVDYRDPWTLGYYTLGYSILSDKLRKLLQRKDELKFLRRADYIITVSESLKATFPHEFQHKIHVVSNGANTDEINFERINCKPDVFSILYAGTLHLQQFENVYFFEVISSFIKENKINPEFFKLNFIGSSESEELKEAINNFNLRDYTNITDRVELPILYDYMYEASMFLHLKYANRDKIITSKQYDYLALQKPILLPQSDNGDIEESILQNNAGYVCNSKEDLLMRLNIEYKKYLNKEDIRIYRDEKFINSISRNTSSKKLLDLLALDLVPNANIKNQIGELVKIE